MFYCVVSLQVEECGPGAILIDSDTREGCIGRVAEFVRNVLGGRDGDTETGLWQGRAGGITRCLFLAQKDGYIVFDIDPEIDTLPADAFAAGVNECIGAIHRYYSEGGDDEFEVVIYDDDYKGDEWDDQDGHNRCSVVSCLDVRDDGSLWDKENGRPDFAACADKIAARADIPV